MEKRYKEPLDSEKETTINVLYNDNCLSIYTNKVDLQRDLLRVLGEPEREYKKGKSILASRWTVSLDDKSRVSKIILKANIFEL